MTHTDIVGMCHACQLSTHISPGHSPHFYTFSLDYSSVPCSSRKKLLHPHYPDFIYISEQYFFMEYFLLLEFLISTI